MRFWCWGWGRCLVIGGSGIVVLCGEFFGVEKWDGYENLLCVDNDRLW